MAKPCKKCQQMRDEIDIPMGGVLYDSPLFRVVHKGTPIGVAGHMQVVSKRHIQSFANMTDAEAAEIGPLLRHCQNVIMRVTGAPKVFTAALGASFPHFHCHLVPVYEGGPQAWDVFLQEELAAKGHLHVDPAQCTRIALAFKSEIGRDPPASAGGGYGLATAGIAIAAMAAVTFVIVKGRS